MKVLCISSHTGCIANVEGLLQTRGDDVTSFYTHQVIPFTIQEAMLPAIWEQYKDEWNRYDLIITGDSMSLAYLLLKYLDELTPKLILWVMNRFDNQMGHIPNYAEFFRERLNNPKYEKKFKCIPYTDYERIFAAERGVFLREPVLLPYGVKVNTPTFPHYIDEDRSGMTGPPEDTVYIMHYGNDHYFMPFVDLFKQAGISVMRKQFTNIDELKQYKCVVHLPDAFSKFSAFEFLVNDIPVFIPTEEFFHTLNRSARTMPDGTHAIYRFTVNGNIAPKEYIPLCEWYRYPGSKVYFSSLDDLMTKLKTFSKDDRRKKILQIQKDAEYHKTLVKTTYNKILNDLFD